MLIEEYLDQRLVKAEKNTDSLPTIAIVKGSTGCGKTSIIQSWLTEKELAHFFRCSLIN